MAEIENTVTEDITNQGNEGESPNSEKQETPNGEDPPEGEADPAPEGEGDAEENFEDDGAEPEVRKKPISFYVEQRRQKREAKQKNYNGDQEGDPWAGEEEDEGEDEVLDPKILKHLEPIHQKFEAEQQDSDIKNFLSEYPELKPYEAKVRRYAGHASRKDIPINELFFAVAGPALMKIGAKRFKQLQEKANETKQVDNGNRTTATAPKDFANMSNEEFAAYKNSLLQGR